MVDRSLSWVVMAAMPSARSASPQHHETGRGSWLRLHSAFAAWSPRTRKLRMIAVDGDGWRWERRIGASRDEEDARRVAMRAMRLIQSIDVGFAIRRRKTRSGQLGYTITTIAPTGELNQEVRAFVQTRHARDKQR